MGLGLVPRMKKWTKPSKKHKQTILGLIAKSISKSFLKNSFQKPLLRAAQKITRSIFSSSSNNSLKSRSKNTFDWTTSAF
jgi:hypothetical protein